MLDNSFKKKLLSRALSQLKEYTKSQTMRFKELPRQKLNSFKFSRMLPKQQIIVSAVFEEHLTNSVTDH